MSKISDLLASLALSRSEMLELRECLDRSLKGHKVTIRQTYKRCGKEGCSCEFGELKRFGHGPYLYASWTDPDNGAQLIYLGKSAAQEEIEEMRLFPEPHWLDYSYPLSAKKSRKTSAGPLLWERTMLPSEFLRFYGVTLDEDRLNRDTMRLVNDDAYESAVRTWQAEQDALNGEFSHLGIVTPRAVGILRRLVSQGYEVVLKQ